MPDTNEKPAYNAGNATTNAPAIPTGNPESAEPITDKRGFGKRWGFSIRHVDNLLAQGLPHLKIGKRRVRIILVEADAWMKERFACRRIGKAGTA